MDSYIVGLDCDRNSCNIIDNLSIMMYLLIAWNLENVWWYYQAVAHSDVLLFSVMHLNIKKWKTETSIHGFVEHALNIICTNNTTCQIFWERRERYGRQFTIKVTANSCKINRTASDNFHNRIYCCMYTFYVFAMPCHHCPWKKRENESCVQPRTFTFCTCQTNIYIPAWIQFSMVNCKQFIWYFMSSVTIPNQMVCNEHTARSTSFNWQETAKTNHKEQRNSAPIKWYFLSIDIHEVTKWLCK